MMYYQEDYYANEQQQQQHQEATAAYMVDPFMLQNAPQQHYPATVNEDNTYELGLDLTGTTSCLYPMSSSSPSVPEQLPSPIDASMAIVPPPALDCDTLTYPPFYSPDHSTVPSPVNDGFDFFTSSYSPPMQDDLPTPPPLTAFHHRYDATTTSLLFDTPYSPPESPIDTQCFAHDLGCHDSTTSSVVATTTTTNDIATSRTTTTNNTTTTMQHDDSRPFACPMCSRAFKRKHDLQRHVRVHTGAKPYACLCCKKAFARTDALKRHLRMEEACRTSPEIQAMKCAGKRRYRNL
ncbi:hypothetical protein RO3G_12338 [Lichtheimia corymbifera JMRC:FSU:9682]|uniref:C2H2-type domain-containing protein n=1 Tax=Lichtheimia corymbifera JMRC:FSU:9682 TaxID=1263082 RepID=A0A068SBL4_9FUNG|nr:hypothetical protein RO3G_12338 [Lichtheimia corymbifera JMRC:FSU:9682]